MKVFLNEELRRHYIDIARKRVDKDRGKQIHASDVDVGLCLQKTLYRRILKDPPPLSDKSILFFASGVCFEHWLVAKSIPVKEREGITRTLDDSNIFGAVELKSTRSNCDKFNPITAYPWWLSRMKTYCYIDRINRMHLVVFFWVGNRAENQIELKAWSIEFTDEEIRDNWIKIKERANILTQCMESGENIPREFLTVRDWECKSCQFLTVCYIKKSQVKDEMEEPNRESRLKQYTKDVLAKTLDKNAEVLCNVFNEVERLTKEE